MLDLITRAEWGARHQDGVYRDGQPLRRPMPFTEFWLHHSATIAPDLVAPFTDDDEAVRTLERIGESRFGTGISYNQPVTPVGRVYVGVSPDRVGSHTYMHNTPGFAFVLVGNHTSKPPTAAQEEAIARRMVELHRQGKAARHTLNGGHRDASHNSTSCPGDAAHARIPYINRRAEELWAQGYAKVGTGGMSAPPPNPGPIPAPKPGQLVVDGKLGPATTRRWQQVVGTTADGVISRPSELVRAVQRHLNRHGARLVVDGYGIASNNGGDYGPTLTVKALQRYLGTTVDGVLSHPTSDAVRALQRRLNTGRF